MTRKKSRLISRVLGTGSIGPLTPPVIACVRRQVPLHGFAPNLSIGAAPRRSRNGALWPSISATSRRRPSFTRSSASSWKTLRCGVLAHGFLRLHCDECGHDRLVAFSCKRRGFCPSCGGRRMADTAAHLVDRVLPEVPIRQWVLTLPYPLRYRCAYDARLASEVLRAFIRTLFAELRRRARRHSGVRAEQCGAVTFLQRFGSALDLNVHFHTLALRRCFSGSSRSTRALPALRVADAPDRGHRRPGRRRAYPRMPEASGTGASSRTRHRQTGGAGAVGG